MRRGYGRSKHHGSYTGQHPGRRMIAEHNAFLSWAMSEDADIPRIPSRRADRGGFAEMLKAPGARAAIEHWWRRVLTTLRDGP